MSPEQFLAAIAPYVPSIVSMAAIVAVVFGVHHLIRRKEAKSVKQDHLREQLLLLALWLAGIVALILALPVEDETSNQLLGLFGLLLSAAIGLSSTTFVGNAMAGLMLKGMHHVNPGDFVAIGEHFGRITDRGLFHTEIQTEDRDLVNLPNLYLVTTPLRVVRSSGTVVAAVVSLGYDLSRTRVEARLLEAAHDAGLKDPFVQVRELGDYSITWRVGGILEGLRALLSTRSKLREAMLDRLHGDGIEIVSPEYRNERVLDPKSSVLPDPLDVVTLPEGMAVDDVVFDKADIAASLERLQARHAALVAEVEELRAKHKVEDDPMEVAALETKIRRMVQLLAAALRAIEDRERRKQEG